MTVTIAAALPAAARTGRIQVAPPAPLGDGDLDRLLAGRHHDPHAVLGAHQVPDGVAVRVLRPLAEAVAVQTAHGRTELVHQRDGLFTALLRDAPPEGRLALTVVYGGRECDQVDGYTFLPTLSDLDLHLIREGRHEQLWRALGARVREIDGVAGVGFAVWAPNAAGVRLVGDFNGWNGIAHPLRSLGRGGVWEVFVPGLGDGVRYKYEIATPDGGLVQKADPLARAAECPPSTASIVHSSHYHWTDQDWMARRAEEPPVSERPMSVYEVHLSSWRPRLDRRRLAEELPAYVAELGFTHVEFLPAMEHPFGGSWGYQVTGFYAPTARLGSPDDFKHLVDACHRAGIGVIMDWVPAHFPKDGFALGRFDGTPLYEPADPLRAEHPDWGTYEFDYGRAEVRNFLVANAVYWGEEFHIDGLRVDAVASMLYLDYSRSDGEWTPNADGGREDTDAIAFLQEMNATVYRRCPGIVTIAEESTAFGGVTRPTDAVVDGRGGLGFGLKWNMGWMHDTLEYMGKEPVHRKWHHNLLTFGMIYAYSENYVLPISHDEVVHGKGALVSKMPGDWWRRRANLRAYLGFMWAHPGKQLLFMGQEFGQGAEWDHERGPQWWVLDEDWPAREEHRGIQRLVRELNHLYRETAALWRFDSSPRGFRWLDADAADDNVLAFARHDEATSGLVLVSNFSPVVRHGYRLGVPAEGGWEVVVDTDDPRFGGSGARGVDPRLLHAEPIPWQGQEQSVVLPLPPLATLWLRPAPPERGPARSS
jgi:1,4-alpha-glucan branching enzyme